MALGALTLLATSLALSAGADGATELAALPAGLPAALLTQALPSAPTKVELKTGYFGTVTLDHEAHLRRQAHCKDCHGSGRVGPIEFTPREAHERCRSCHTERKKGPTDCRGCHVLPAAPPAAADPPAPAPASTPASSLASAPASSPATATTDGAPAPDTGAAPPAGASPVAAKGAASVHEEVRLDEPPPPVPFLRAIQLGGVAGSGAGLSVRLSLRREALVVSHALDRLGGWGRSRTLVTMGVGASLPVEGLDALRVEADGLGGLDVTASPGPDVLPALGARVGLAWAPPWARGYPLVFNVTGLVDLLHRGIASPACAYATFGIGTRPVPR